MDKTNRKTVLGLMAGTLVFTAPTVWAEGDVYDLRVSVDTNMQTSRTAHLAKYLDEIKERSGGRLNPILYHSAQFYADRDVGKALAQSAVEMAMPVSWTLSAYRVGSGFPRPAQLRGPVGRRSAGDRRWRGERDHQCRTGSQAAQQGDRPLAREGTDAHLFGRHAHQHLFRHGRPADPAPPDRRCSR